MLNLIFHIMAGSHISTIWSNFTKSQNGNAAFLTRKYLKYGSCPPNPFNVLCHACGLSADRHAFENFNVAASTQWCLHCAVDISKFICRCPPLIRQCMKVNIVPSRWSEEARLHWIMQSGQWQVKAIRRCWSIGAIQIKVQICVEGEGTMLLSCIV